MYTGTGQKTYLMSLLGTPIYADISFLFLMLFFLVVGYNGTAASLQSSIILLIVAAPSIIIHELGHAMMIRRRGLGQSTIVLGGMGGACMWSGHRATRIDQILVSLAGPAAGLAVGLPVLAYVQTFGYPGNLWVRTALWYVLFVNIGWSIFNLMPLWPMDGGAALRAFLSTRRQGLRLSLQISMATAVVLGLLALQSGETFILLLLLYFGWLNFQEYQGRSPSGPQGPQQKTYYRRR